MFLKRLGYLLPWRRRAAERDMTDELRSLAEMARPGELGNLTLAAEDARAEWGWTRLELKGWIAAKWEKSEHNRPAKVYRLTPAGRRHLQREKSEWASFVNAVARIMKPAAGEVDS